MFYIGALFYFVIDSIFVWMSMYFDYLLIDAYIAH